MLGATHTHTHTHNVETKTEARRRGISRNKCAGAQGTGGQQPPAHQRPGARLSTDPHTRTHSPWRLAKPTRHSPQSASGALGPLQSSGIPVIGERVTAVTPVWALVRNVPTRQGGFVHDRFTHLSRHARAHTHTHTYTAATCLCRRFGLPQDYTTQIACDTPHRTHNRCASDTQPVWPALTQPPPSRCKCTPTGTPPPRSAPGGRP